MKKTEYCPKCGSNSLLPLDTPKAQAVLKSEDMRDENERFAKEIEKEKRENQIKIFALLLFVAIGISVLLNSFFTLLVLSIALIWLYPARGELLFMNRLKNYEQHKIRKVISIVFIIIAIPIGFASYFSNTDREKIQDAREASGETNNEEVSISPEISAEEKPENEWKGKTYQEAVAIRGEYDHYSDYRQFDSYQGWCWEGETPSCLIDENNDGIIDSFE